MSKRLILLLGITL